MATTTYVSKDQWSDAHGYASWDAFSSEGSGDEDHPSSTLLDSILLKSSRIMNNAKHLNTRGTNITNTDMLTDVRDYIITMTDRQLDVANARGDLGGQMFTSGMQNWSNADFLMSYERQDVQEIALELGTKVRGKVG